MGAPSGCTQGAEAVSGELSLAARPHGTLPCGPRNHLSPNLNVMSGITVLSPLGINRVEARPVAARIGSLQGIRLGLINNNKPNAAALLDGVSNLIDAQHGLSGTDKKQKPHSSVGAEGLDAFVKNIQAALVAVGD
jgi:hypothetical protein